MYEPDLILECQSCGDEIYRSGDPADQAVVANNPYSYIMFCRECKSAGYHIEI